MHTTPSSTALVLGGGGSAGNAWLIGVLAGLSDGGLDVTDADLIIGTSAGSTAAAQITGASLDDLFVATAAPLPEQRPRPTPGGAAFPRVSATEHLDLMRVIIAASHDPADMRRRMGSAMLGPDHDDAASPRWRSTVAARLPSQDWPDRRVLITAVDAVTGEPVVFDRTSGVDLVDAIAASCAGGFAYRIGDRRFIDGGYRRNENADLAAGHGRVLVLSPLGGRTMHPLEWGMQLAAQVEELRAAGSTVETILPDADSLTAFGDNMMDLSTRPGAARAGFAQGEAFAPALSGFWR